jgi:negative regulator of flagellin synthesis FlgM
MNNTISSNGLPQLPLTTGNTDSNANQTNATTSASSSAAPQSTDSVKLTDSARALSQASSTDSPVDSAKVEAIKKSLADGTYKLDPNAIANSLISMDKQIGGK